MAVALLSVTAVLAGCATPPASEPRGKWMPVNRMSETTMAIPLNQAYVYQAAPIDRTLKGLVTRWAKDSGLILSYQHPNDYTLYGPVAKIRTSSAGEAAAALSAAYAAQGVLVTVDNARITVSVAGASTAAGASATDASDQ
ncbi:hypothetical protein [Stenotrophomonas sp.]|uniref:hypothetical protein n=1 Tax=Stenotrophomonas sp. TaxID=69392 RepID=UPI00289BA615|nr:hypothetical protein [Stenotrophomonas sp.]